MRPSPPRRQAECRDAERVLLEGGTSAGRGWVLSFIGLCPQLGEVLPAVWREPPRGAEELQSLFWLTRGLRDPEVFEAVFAAAVSSDRPARVRVAALGVLGAHVDSTLTLDLDSLPSEEEGKPGAQGGSGAPRPTCPWWNRGRPLPDDALQVALSAAREIADAPTTPGRVRTAARHVAATLDAMARTR